MPLLDHFRPPLYPRHHWESFHSNWATRIADALNERLPPEFLAEEHTSAGARLEIDVATYQEQGIVAAPGPNGPATAIVPQTWAPPAPPHTIPATFPDAFEVRVFSTTGGLTLVGAIELVSPGNKDPAEERHAFAVKCASYLLQGVSAIVIDIVTTRRANLHNESMRLVNAPSVVEFPADVELYAVAYRPVLRQDRPEIDVWPVPCALGSPLPVLPLRLTGDLFVPVDFDATYREACRRRRFPS
ncbi:MAG TPA: DUF4058 family protein [Gemmataceae bacterium]|nr:DUF4058 family protein [Gemmataceae bacterium]